MDFVLQEGVLFHSVSSLSAKIMGSWLAPYLSIQTLFFFNVLATLDRREKDNPHNVNC